MNALSDVITDPRFALAFRVREPAAVAPSALLVLLHGVGGNETNLAALATDVPADTLVVLPRGPLELGAGQYAWFRVAFTASGPQIDADEAEDSRQRLVRFVAQLQDSYGIAPTRTVIAGFSQGGILSASVALSAPERVRGFAVLSGRILPELEPHLATRARLVGLQALIAHGRDDSKLPVAWAQRANAWLHELGVAHTTALYPGDHGIPPQMARDFLDWQRALLLPPPAAPARLLLDGEDARIVGGRAGELGRLIAPGIARLLREHFRRGTAPALAMENAIAVIEDDLARVPRELHGITVASNDPALHDIARAAGLGDSSESISREAIEQVFARQSSVALGRPALSEGLPEDPAFTPALLLVRELMHHLDIASIQIGDRGHPGANVVTAVPPTGAES